MANFSGETDRLDQPWEVRVTYLIRVAIAVLGGAGTAAAYHQTRDPIFAAVVAFVVIAAFIAAYLTYR
jgi:hypothetical protein